MKAKLTKKSLPDIIKASSGKPTYVWDTDLNGFGAYVSPKGDVSWLVQKWMGGRGGKSVRHVIGKTKDGMDVLSARSLAASSIGDIHKGVDLALHRKSRREAIRSDLNAIKVHEALDLFFKKRGDTRYEVEMERNLRKALAPYEKASLKSITKADIRAIIDEKDDHPVAQRNLFAALRPFFKWCLEKDLLSVSPMESLSPPAPVKSRDRQLSKQEIKALWDASYHMPDIWGSFYRLLLLTGQRREEVASMEWAELDLVSKTWTIPKEKAKNGKAHIVHLSPLALHELSLLPQAKSFAKAHSLGSVCQYVFPSRDRGHQLKDSHISGFSQMKSKLDGYMDCEAWRVHDLRRTMASGLAEYGFPTDVVDRILNHVSGSQGGIKGVYQRYSFLKEREQALNTWSDIVAEITRPWVRVQ